MDRKAFLRKTMRLGFFSSILIPLQSGTIPSICSNSDTEFEKLFKENWIISLMENFEKDIDPSTRKKLMEACGRDCAKRYVMSMAESCKGDVKKLIKILTQSPQINITHRHAESIQVTYKKCLCELVNKGPERLPHTYCECSKGWLLQVFEEATRQAVTVKILQTIKRGGSSCDFIIKAGL